MSIGWLVHQSNTHIMLAQSLAEDGDTCGRFMIPNGFIKEVQAL